MAGNELALLSAKYERVEAEDESDLVTEQEPKATGPEAEPEVEPEAGENTALVVLTVVEQGVKLVIDDRLYLDDEDKVEGCQALGPVFSKYGLVFGGGDGDGKAPYQDEIMAGFWLGRMIKRTIQAVRDLRADDKQKKQERAADGDQRKHEPTEQARPISSEERTREESDDEAPGWLGS